MRSKMLIMNVREPVDTRFWTVNISVEYTYIHRGAYACNVHWCDSTVT